MSFDYYQSVIGKMRKGTADDSFIDVNETLQVVNSKVVLSEIPDKFNGLVVKTVFGNTALVEIKKGTPTNNQYLCDYNLGVVHFPDTVNNERYVFSYKGRGAVYLAAERIYTKQMNSEEIIQTLRDVLDEVDSIINLSERFTNTGAYSATKVYYGRNIVTYDNAAYMCINNSADGIINIPPSNSAHWRQIVSVKQAIQNAETATANANTATTNANSASNYATGQGDYAKTQGDRSKNLADTFVFKGSYDNAVQYLTNNVVNYNGSTYRCKSDSKGILPSDTTKWELMAQAGDTPRSELTLVDNKIGDLTNLTTSDKGSVVAAINEHTSQLADATKKNNGLITPAISFIDDDGAPQVYTKLLPLSQQKDIPYGVAFIYGHTNDLTLTQLQELKSNGFEILNHGTDAITDLLAVDDATAEAEIIKSKNWLESNGFVHDVFVYSMGRIDSAKRKIISKYNRFAFDIYNPQKEINTAPIDTYNITRVEFGRDGKDFNYYKNLIDKTKADQGWLVFEQHSWYTDFTQDKIDLTVQVVDYARSIGVDVVSPTEGFDRFKNVIDLGISGVEEEAEDSYFYLGANGEVKASTNLKFVGGKVKDLETKFIPSADISEFPKGSVTNVRFYNAEIPPKAVAGDPSTAGTLEVVRDNMDDSFGHRFWHGYNQNDELYYSGYIKDSGWTPFLPIFDKVFPDNTITPSTTFDTGVFLNRRRFYCYVTGTNCAAFPFGQTSGMVIVDSKVIGKRYSISETFIDLDKMNTFVRYYNLADNSWSKWYTVGEVRLVMNTITPTFNPVTTNVLGVIKCLVSGTNATAFGLSDVGIATIKSTVYDGTTKSIELEVTERGKPVKAYAFWDVSTSAWTSLLKPFNRIQKSQNINTTIPANGQVTIDISITNANMIFDDAVTIAPKGPIAAGLLISSWIKDGSTVQLRIHNTTGADILLNKDFSVNVIKTL